MQNRPQDPCINFNCGWVVGESPLPDWMKPDNAKVIVIFNKMNWRGLPVDVAVPVGRKIPPRALNWLKDFSQRSGRPLLFSEQIKGKRQVRQPSALQRTDRSSFNSMLPSCCATTTRRCGDMPRTGGAMLEAAW